MEVKDLGDYYNGDYKPGDWNYDYTQSDTSCPSCSSDKKCGPACWSEVIAKENEKANYCGGNKQSPIDLFSVRIDPNLSFESNLKFQVIDGGCNTWAQFANDHVFEISFKNMHCANLKVSSNLRCYLASNCSDFETYTLTQFHFHTPSEHTVGNMTDGELHMVHINEPGTHALVIGVRLQATPLNTGADSNLNNRPVTPRAERNVSKSFEPYVPPVDQYSPNPFLSTFWDVWEQGGGGEANLYEVSAADDINPYADFLPEHKSFFTYSGSLTSYPCSEIVTWVVFESSLVVFPEDIDNLRRAVAASPYTITYTAEG